MSAGNRSSSAEGWANQTKLLGITATIQQPITAQSHQTNPITGPTHKHSGLHQVNKPFQLLNHFTNPAQLMHYDDQNKLLNINIWDMLS